MNAGTSPAVDMTDGLEAVWSRLHAFIARRVASVDTADDLTQEVLVRLLTAFHNVRLEPDDPAAWLYRVARNVIIDHYRAQASVRRRHTHDEPTEDPAEDPFADDPQAARRELAGCLRSLIAKLPEPYRWAVTAVDLEGLAQADAAHAAGLTVSGMKSRVQRGRQQLGRLLGECCEVHIGPGGGISSYQPLRGCKPDPTCRSEIDCGNHPAIAPFR